MATLAARDLKKTYTQAHNTLHILRGVSYEFLQAKSYAITGPSGSGKSTLMHILAGLDEPTQGAVFLNGINIHTLSESDKRSFLANSLGIVFQQPYLISELSVIENVMLKGMIAGNPSRVMVEQAHELLDKIKLSHKATSDPRTLSGGEQQRVALARALFSKPAFLLADEPTASLDVATGKVIVQLLLSCVREWGMGVIVCSHDAYVADEMGHVLRMENGILQ
jgi:ABC-type lipoprotein export system ATPase subunit